MLEQEAPLNSMAQEIIDQCPRFRILLVGKSGAGKSSLVNKTFGVDLAAVSHSKAGISDINHEITWESNPYFVLHDSQGFEPGERENIKTVKEFIAARGKERKLSDRLHAIWHVIETPVAGARVLELGDHQFLDGLDNLPVISIFTKYDLLLSSFALQFDDDARIMEEADKVFRDQCLGPLTAIKRSSHAHARVSIESDESISVLIEITRCLLSGESEKAKTLSSRIIPIRLPSGPALVPIRTIPDVSNTPPGRHKKKGSFFRFKLRSTLPQSGENQPQSTPAGPISSFHGEPNEGPSSSGPSRTLDFDEDPANNLAEPVILAWAVAQRMNPQVNIDASIAVGRKRYWSTLAASTHFPGHTLNKCLDTLIKDIVIVWNFNDPQKNLISKNFKALLSLVVEDLANPDKSQSRNITRGLQGIAGTVGVVVAAVGLPQPIGIPIIAGLALASWVWGVYKRTPGILRCLMAFIVDLTMVMHRLFWLMRAQGTGHVTTALIILAIRSYLQPGADLHAESAASRIHSEIRSYVDEGYFLKNVNPGHSLTQIIHLIKSPAFNPLPNYEEWAREAVRDFREETQEELQVWE